MSLMLCDCGGMICRDGCFDCQFKGNFKPRIMNEYKGFKVGDEVKVLNENKTTITTGKISRFGDRKMGGCMEPDTMQVIIGGTKSFDMLYLVSHNLIVKVHKYALGDVVRIYINDNVNTSNGKPLEHYNGRLFTIGSDDDGKFSMADDPHSDKCLFIEKYLLPFDGFRVGDTVWTVKRGKGKIIGNVYDNAKRPFAVDFAVPNGMFLRWHSYDGIHYPKLSNLIPTEAKYKEAIGEPTPGSFTVDIAFVAPYNPTVDVKFSASPKFKVGDAVFYKGEKWEVMTIKQRTDSLLLLPNIKYDINRQVTPNGGVGACVNESDLRLWKETKFTHGLHSNGTWVEHKDGEYKIAESWAVEYLGKIIGHDTFLITAKNAAPCLFRGEKGDDC